MIGFIRSLLQPEQAQLADIERNLCEKRISNEVWTAIYGNSQPRPRGSGLLMDVAPKWTWRRGVYRWRVVRRLPQQHDDSLNPHEQAVALMRRNREYLDAVTKRLHEHGFTVITAKVKADNRLYLIVEWRRPGETETLGEGAGNE